MQMWLEMIGGRLCLVRDVCCDDYDRARANRERVANGYATSWWDYYERARTKWKNYRFIPEVVSLEGELFYTADLVGA